MHLKFNVVYLKTHLFRMTMYVIRVVTITRQYVHTDTGNEHGHTEVEATAYKIDRFFGTFLIPYTIMFRIHMIIDLA